MKTLIVFLMVLGTVFVSSLYHEFVHQMIYKTYGVSSRTYFDIRGFTWYTEPLNYSEIENLTGSEYCEMTKLHLLNEIVGYNILMFACMFIVCTLCVISELCEINQKLDKILKKRVKRRAKA